MEWLLYSAITGILAAILSYLGLKSFRNKLLSAGIAGKDLNKDMEKLIPESGGTPVLLAYLITTVGMSIFLTDEIKLAIYAPLLSISIALFLGFMDDVLKLRWRYKLLIPAVASVPLIASFNGSTSVTLPCIGQIELGFIYLFIFVPALNIYLGNAINILAGINLIEVGQSFILGMTLFILALLRNDVITFYLIIPFLGASLVLAKENKYPARVFVGNSYTYGAGAILVAIAIWGNMEKALLIATLPQIFNFLYSLPQLLSKNCPRHRLPKHKDGLLYDAGHKNLINLVLRLGGPMTEKKLAGVILTIQLIVSIGVIVGYIYAGPF